MASDSTTSTGWRGRLEQGLGGLADYNYRHPWKALAIALVLSLVGVYFARGLSLDSNLVSLLPRSFQSVEDLQQLEKRFSRHTTLAQRTLENAAELSFEQSVLIPELLLLAEGNGVIRLFATTSPRTVDPGWIILSIQGL